MFSVIKKKKNVVVYSNIHDRFASTNLTYKQKLKKHNTKTYLNNNKIEVIENVCPLPGTDQNHLLPLLLPPHIQIEYDLLTGGHCPTWRSCKSSSCGKACHLQAS